MDNVHTHSGPGSQNNNTGSGYQHNTDVTGDNNIVFNTNHTSRPITPPEPFFNEPYIFDTSYVERAHLQQQLQAKVPTPRRRIALVGMGGVGKTQALFNHALHLRETVPNHFIFWLHASNMQRFRESLKDIVERLCIAGRNAPGADHLNLFKQWLSRSRNGRWLIIFDNVDDADVLTGASNKTSTRGAINYIPVCQHGSVVLTTRSSTEARKLGVDENDEIAVGAMRLDDAVAMLVKRLPHLSNRRLFAELANALDRIPLAMAQASAYIRNVGADCSIEHYIDLINAASSRQWLMRENRPLSSRDRESDSSILGTLQITFKRIEQVRPSAIELLVMMSWSDPVYVSDAVLHPRMYICQDTLAFWGIRMQEVASTHDLNNTDQMVDLRYRQDIMVLVDYSLIAPVAKEISSAWTMHRLIQDAMQDWLMGHSSRVPLSWRYLTRLLIKTPISDRDERENGVLELGIQISKAIYVDFEEGPVHLLQDRLAAAFGIWRARWERFQNGVMTDGERENWLTSCHFDDTVRWHVRNFTRSVQWARRLGGSRFERASDAP